jgi:hypothetical protein
MCHPSSIFAVNRSGTVAPGAAFEASDVRVQETGSRAPKQTEQDSNTNANILATGCWLLATSFMWLPL